MKTTQFELRPIFHRRADQLRAHAFVCMLAYYVVWHIRKRLQPLLAKKAKDSGRPRDSFRSLLWKPGSLQRHTQVFGDHTFKKLTIPSKRHEEIFKALDLALR